MGYVRGGLVVKPDRQSKNSAGERHLRLFYLGITFEAWGPFWPMVFSNSTAWPSWRVLKPSL